jgi:putative membrane protein insertion efficiency factor
MERRNLGRLLNRALQTMIRCYQLSVSPLLLPSCRYLPSCSDYAVEAIGRHGSLVGLGLALRRLARCHPWGGSGYDPVPATRGFDRSRSSVGP